MDQDDEKLAKAILEEIDSEPLSFQSSPVSSILPITVAILAVVSFVVVIWYTYDEGVKLAKKRNTQNFESVSSTVEDNNSNKQSLTRVNSGQDSNIKPTQPKTTRSDETKFISDPTSPLAVTVPSQLTQTSTQGGQAVPSIIKNTTANTNDDNTQTLANYGNDDNVTITSYSKSQLNSTNSESHISRAGEQLSDKDLKAFNEKNNTPTNNTSTIDTTSKPLADTTQTKPKDANNKLTIAKPIDTNNTRYKETANVYKEGANILPSNMNDKWQVQIAALSSVVEAEQFIQEETAKNSTLFANTQSQIKKWSSKNGKVFYRVRIGPFDDAATAKRKCSQFTNLGNGCFVVAPKQ